MLKNQDEARHFFEILNEYSLHHMSASCKDEPMFIHKKGGIYEVRNSIDIDSKVYELS